MKRKIPQLTCIFILMGILAAFMPPGNITLLAMENFMGVDEITPGMKGYGKTVFSGDRIEIFDVEVLGIIKNWEAKSDMILIRMSGGPLEKSGIIAGMSGSPVYINNRLIGAVAYGWSFAKDPIAGVTPIDEMKSTLLDIPTKENDISVTSADWELPSLPQPDLAASLQKNPLIPHEATCQQLHNNTRLTPILSPCMVSGVDSGVLQGMHTFFSAFGLYPVQGGSSISSGNTSGKLQLEPGASVAAVLIRGDLNAAVVGTVTHVEGNTILAFGHPFLQTGKANLPMASAYVYTVLSSQSNSVKMASPLDIIGRISQDRKSGIAGTLGETAHMVPCHIEIEGSQKRTYDFEIIDNKLLTPSLVLMATQSAVLSTENKVGEKSVSIKLSTQIDGYEKPIVIENAFYELDQSWFSINHIIQPFAMILNNPFQKVQINRIDIKVKIFDTRQTAYIEAIRVDKKQSKPGDALQIDVRIKPFTGESFYQTVKIQIPEDTLPGSILNVTTCDAMYGQALNIGRSAGKYLPTNFDQLIQYIENMERNNHLLVRVLLSKKGLTYKGEGFPSLPSSIFSIMAFSNQSGTGPLFDEVITRIPTAYVLNGNQSIPISVK